MNRTRPSSSRATVGAVSVALGLTAALSMALVVDQIALGTIASHVVAHYGRAGLDPDVAVLFAYLYTVSALGAGVWLLVLRWLRRDVRRASVALMAVVLLAAAAGVFHLTVSELGGRILPTGWGVAGLLPPAAGVVAVVLHRRERAVAAGRPA